MLRFDLNSSKHFTKKFCKYAVFLFPIFFILILVAQKFLFGPTNELYANFAKEDGFVEYVTSILYFLSFMFSIIIGLYFIKVKNNIFATLYLLFSAVFLFIAFEEISWGQRIFHLETTEFFSENVQNEINFHNLPSTSSINNLMFFLVGLIGTFFSIFLSKLKTQKFKSFIKFFIPQRFLMFYFIPAFLFYGFVRNEYFRPPLPKAVFDFFTWPDMEVIELLLSAGIFLFLFSKILGIVSVEKAIGYGLIVVGAFIFLLSFLSYITPHKIIIGP